MDRHRSPQAGRWRCLSSLTPGHRRSTTFSGDADSRFLRTVAIDRFSRRSTRGQRGDAPRARRPADVAFQPRARVRKLRQSRGCVRRRSANRNKCTSWGAPSASGSPIWRAQFPRVLNGIHKEGVTQITYDCSDPRQPARIRRVRARRSRPRGRPASPGRMPPRHAHPGCKPAVRARAGRSRAARVRESR